MALPRINDKDPSGMIRTEMRAAKRAEDIINDAVKQARDFVIRNNITDARVIDLLVERVMVIAREQLQREGLTWVRDTENEAVIRTNKMIERMGQTSVILGPIGLPREITDRLGTIVMAEVESLTLDVRAKVSRTLIDGMNRGLGARQLGKMVQEVTQGDIARARTIARTTVMKTSNEVALEDYRRAGAAGYMLYPTEDERLCVDCRKAAFENGMSGNLRVYTEQEINGLFPVHPNCRCTIIGHFEGDEPVSLLPPALEFVRFEERIDVTN